MVFIKLFYLSYHVYQGSLNFIMYFLFTDFKGGFMLVIVSLVPVPVAARSKAFVFGRSPAQIVGSNPTGCMDVCLL